MEVVRSGSRTLMPDEIIRRLSAGNDVEDCARLLREAFGTVAREHGLTEELVATNAAFTTAAKLRLYLTRPVELYGLCVGDVLIGCVAIQPAKGSTRDFSIEKLAVSPKERHRGHGGRLLWHACQSIRKKGGTRALLGLMDTNTPLKEWYKSKGFKQIECRSFSHLPFKVCSMCKDLNAGP